MPLIKNNQIVEDTWIAVDDDADIPATGNVIVGYDCWREQRDHFASHAGRVGVRLKSDQPPSLINGSLHAIDLIALEFPAYTDGRAYSYARLLRDRYGFEGEIRAVGDVLRDQAFYMLRCGFDSFAVTNENALSGWLDAFEEFTHVYQPATDQRAFVIHQRHYTAQAAE